MHSLCPYLYLVSLVALPGVSSFTDNQLLLQEPTTRRRFSSSQQRYWYRYSSFLNRIAGLCASIIAANIPGANPNAPVFVSGAVILAAFVAMVFLPIETRGKQML